MTHVTTLAFAMLLFLVFLIFIIILSIVLAKSFRREGPKIDIRLPEIEEPYNYGWEDLFVPKASTRKKPGKSKPFLKTVFSILIILVGLGLIAAAIIVVLGNSGELFGIPGAINATASENVTQDIGEKDISAQETDMQNETAQNATWPLPDLMQQFNISQINFNFSEAQNVLASDVSYGHAAGTIIGIVLLVLLIVWYVGRRRKLTSRASSAAGKILKDKEKKRREEKGESRFKQYLTPLFILVVTLILAGGLLYAARSRIAGLLNLVG